MDLPPTPATVTARAVGLGLVRVQWPAAVANTESALSRYRLERRVGLTGEFEVVADNIKLTPDSVVYFDMHLEPETFYGYRVHSVASIGRVSPPTTIAGAKTPPLPGVVVTTSTSLQSLPFASRDGYLVTVTNGADSTRERLTPVNRRRFSPLKPGPYAVELHGIPKNCSVANGDSLRSVVVTDTGVVTLSTVDFDLVCRDPTKAQVVVLVNATGKDLDSDGYSVALSRTVQSAPILKTTTINGSSGSTAFVNLDPGSYQIELSGVAPNCSLATGLALKRPVSLAVLASDTVKYDLHCLNVGPPDTRPLRLSYQFTPTTAPPGANVAMDVFLDMTPRGTTVEGLTVITKLDTAVLKFTSFAAQDPLSLSVGPGKESGRIVWTAAAFTPPGPSGLAKVARFVFKVTNTAQTGGETTTESEITSAVTTVGGIATTITSEVGPDEGTFVVAAGNVGSNQPPVARANGPYTGAAGQPISFSAAGSSDADGSIVSYVWSFSDGGSATGSSAQHTFAAAGSYTATITVTDDKGATGTAQIGVTVASGGTQNQSPVANANGPYRGTAGQPIAFSGLGSSDPDGSITTYAWSFSDGGTATGQSVQHTFATAGPYTATLTVTDDKDATGTNVAQVTIAPAGSGDQPFTLRNTFTGPDGNGVVTLLVSLELGVDIPETPGPEALGNFIIGSLRVDPSVLTYYSFNLGGTGFGVVDGNVDLSNAISTGTFSFSGRAASTTGQPTVIPLARIGFKIKGASGTSATTQTQISALISTTALGTFLYTGKTSTQEGTFVVP